MCFPGHYGEIKMDVESAGCQPSKSHSELSACVRSVGKMEIARGLEANPYF